MIDNNVLLETLTNIRQTLKESPDSDCDNTDSMALRLEVVAEAALLNENIPLEVCDLINQARQI